MARKPKCNNCKAWNPPTSFVGSSCYLGYDIECIETRHTALGDYCIYCPKDGKCKKPKNNAEYISLLEDKRMGIL